MRIKLLNRPICCCRSKRAKERERCNRNQKPQHTAHVTRRRIKCGDGHYHYFAYIFPSTLFYSLPINSINIVIFFVISLRTSYFIVILLQTVFPCHLPWQRGDLCKFLFYNRCASHREAAMRENGRKIRRIEKESWIYVYIIYMQQYQIYTSFTNSWKCAHNRETNRSRGRCEWTIYLCACLAACRKRVVEKKRCRQCDFVHQWEKGKTIIIILFINHVQWWWWKRCSTWSSPRNPAQPCSSHVYSEYSDDFPIRLTAEQQLRLQNNDNTVCAFNIYFINECSLLLQKSSSL